MPLHLTAVLDNEVNSSSGGLSDWAIRRNFMESIRRLLEATGAIDLFRFEIMQAATLQYVSLGSDASAIVNVCIGVFDFRQDMARIIHTISNRADNTLISASTALVMFRPNPVRGRNTAGITPLLGLTPSWTHNVPREVKDLLQTVSLPMTSPLSSPVTWDYRAAVK